MRFYRSMPKDFLISGHQLYKCLQSKLGTGEDAKITDLFFIKTGEGLQFLKKNTLKGKWQAFVTWIRRLFRSSEDSFSIESHLNEVSELFKNIITVDEKFFKQVAEEIKEPGLTGEKLKNEFIKLQQHFQTLKADVESKRLLKQRDIRTLAGIEIPKFAEKTVGIGESAFERGSQFFNDASRLVGEALGRVSSSPIEEPVIATIVSVLSAHVNGLDILRGLQDHQATQTSWELEVLQPLRVALINALPTVSEQAAEQLLQVIQLTTIPDKDESSEEFMLDMNAFAAVFGDSFLAHSGFEGHVSSRPFTHLAAKFIAKKKMDTPLAKQLHHLMEHPINVDDSTCSAADLRDKIKKSLDEYPFEPKRCLLFGGWTSHAILYEIERQENGNFTFRIYNEGEGGHLVDHLKGIYSDKIAGCIGIKNIPEKNLYKRNFLACLQGLTSMSKDVIKEENPDQILINQILPLLSGEKELMDPRIEHFLSPQQSGTCTYKSLHAFFAHKMRGEDFYLFECQFKTYLLQEFLPKMRKLAAKVIDGEQDYSLQRAHYAIIKRSIEEFSRELGEFDPLLPEQDVENARKEIVEYQALLAQFKQNLAKYERKVFSGSLEQLTAGKSVSFSVIRYWSSKTSKNQSSCSVPKMYSISKEALALDEIISQIPTNSADSNYSRSIESAIESIKDISQISDSEQLYLIDQFFKRVGPLSNWKNVKFSDPVKTLHELNIIGSRFLSVNLSVSSTDLIYMNTKQMLMFLSISYAFENAFEQCPQDKKILQSKNVLTGFKECLRLLKSKQSGNGRDTLSTDSFHISDPYWVSMLQEMRTLGEKESLNLFNKFPNDPAEFRGIDKDVVSLFKTIKDDIWTWWMGDHNRSLRKHVSKSVRKDRVEQEKEKERLIQLKHNELKILKIELEQCKNSESKWFGSEADLERLRIRISQLKTQIDAVNLKIARIPTEVDADPKYWPKIFNQPEINRDQIVSFFFADRNQFLKNKIEKFDLLPPEFRMGVKFWMFSRRLFYVTAWGSRKNYDWSFQPVLNDPPDFNAAPNHTDFEIRETHMWSAKTEQRPPGNRSKLGALDPFIEPQNKQTSTFYNDLFGRRIEEGELPVVESHLGSVRRENPLPFQVWREIMILRSAREVQLESTLDYFSDHLNCLNQGDWIKQFHSLIFESDLLLEGIRDDEKRELLLDQFRKFFNGSIDHFIQIEEFQAAANLAWIASKVELYVNFVNDERERNGRDPFTSEQVFKPEWFIEILQKAKSPKHRKMKRVIAEAFLAGYNNALKKIPETDKEKKLLVLALLQQIARLRISFPGQVDSCYFREAEAQECLITFRKYFSGTLLSSDEVAQWINDYGLEELNTIIPALNAKSVTLSSIFFPQRNGLFFTNEGSSICLTSGKVRLADPRAECVYDQPVPDNLAIFNEIYPSPESRLGLRSYSIEKNYYIRDNRTKRDFEFNGRDGRIVLTSDGGKGKDWVYVPLSLREGLGNTYLKSNFHYFQTEEAIYLCNKETFAPIYTIKERGKINEIQTIPLNDGDPVYHLVDRPALTLFERFQPNSAMACWADESEKLKKIEFNNLNLTLENKGNKWILAQDERWALAEEQFVPNFGQGSGFLVFENAAGEKKVVFPLYEPMIKSVDQSLNFSYDYDFSNSITSSQYIECSFVKNELVPTSEEARYYLAKIYLEKGFIDEAEQLMFAHEAELNHRAYSNSEILLLSSLCRQSSKDIGGRNLRIRMRALYLLIRNDEQFRVRTDNQDLNQRPWQVPAIHAVISVLLADYLKKLDQIKFLDPREEIFILENIADEKIKPMVETRLRQLRSEFSDHHDDIQLGHSSVGAPFNKPYETNINLGNYNAPPAHSSWRDKIRYYWARLHNTFPFDPVTITGEDFGIYYELIRKECETVNDQAQWNKIRNNGLIQALVALRWFSPYPTVKENAAFLLNRLFVSKLETSSIYQGMPVRPAPLPNHKRVVRFIHDLEMLNNVQPSSDAIKKEGQSSYLTDLSNSYFDKSITSENSVDGEKLFSSTYPEVVDPTIQAQFKKAKTEIQKANLQQEIYAIKSGMSLIDLKETLSDRLKEESLKLAAQEEMILNGLVSSLSTDPFSQMEFVSKQRSLPTIDQLCLLAARHNYDQFVSDSYPELTAKGRENLRKAIKNYLIQKKFVQHLGRSLQTAQDLIKIDPSDSATQQSLKNSLGKGLEQETCYDLTENPLASIFLLIETILNINLRQDQIDNITLFANGAKEMKEKVIQMIMGAGKTHVLQPIITFLITFLTGDKEHLSTVIVPEALEEPVKDGLFRSLGTAFNQSVYSLPYDRSLSKDLSYLNDYFKGLEEAKKRGACLLLTPRQKHSILTSLYEAYYDYHNLEHKKDHPKNKPFIDRIEAISRICYFMQFSEIDQIDEVDSVMNPQVIFKFPVGVRKQIHPMEASILSRLAIGLATDQEIAQTVSIDFVNATQARLNPDFVKSTTALTKEIYIKSIRPKLVDLAFQHLRELTGDFLPRLFSIDEKGEEYLRHFMTQTTPLDDEIESLCTALEETLLLEKLNALDLKHLNAIANSTLQDSAEDQVKSLIARKILYKKEMKNWLKKYVGKTDEKELFGVFALAISSIFPHSLFSECGSNYGADPKIGSAIARPYEAPDAPKSTVYQSAYEQMIYSAQLALYNGVPAGFVPKILTSMQSQAKNEMEQSGCLLVKTEAYKHYRMILGDEVRHYRFLEDEPSPEFLEALHRGINRNSHAIYKYLEEFVFNQISIYDENISSTPQTIAGSSRLAFGYTGTMMPGILSRTMEAIPEEGTDGKTMTAIQSKMDRDESAIAILSERKDQSLTTQVIERFMHDPSVFVFIDSGGWLKEEKIGIYAEKLLIACEKSELRKGIKGIVIHDQEGQIISVERDPYTKQFIRVPLNRSSYKTTDGSLLTIIQKKYDTGTNIPQLPTAKAEMSIAKEATERDVLQAVFRMRQILQGQKVSFLVSKEVANSLTGRIVDGLVQKEAFRTLFDPSLNLAPFDNKYFLDSLNLPPEDDDLRAGLSGTIEKMISQGILQSLQQKKITKREAISYFKKFFEEEYRISSAAMWRYFEVNQARVSQKKTWTAAQQRMREVIEKPIRMVLFNSKISFDLRYNLFEAAVPILIQKNNASLFSTLLKGTKPMTALQCIEDEIQSNLEKFRWVMEWISDNPQLKNYLEKILEDIYGDRQIADVLRECVNEADIASFMHKGTGEEGQELEAEVDLEVDLLLENETQLQVQQERSNLMNCFYRPLVEQWVHGNFMMNEFIKSFPHHICQGLTSYLPSDLLDIFSSFEDLIHVSPNLALRQAKFGTAESGNYHLPGRFILALSNPEWKNPRFVLVSHEDAQRIKKGMNRSDIQNGCHVALFTFDGKMISGRSEARDFFDTDLKTTVLAIAKLVTGKLYYKKKELKRLREIFDSINKRFILEKFFMAIISYLPNVAKHYHGSRIARFLRKK